MTVSTGNDLEDIDDTELVGELIARFNEGTLDEDQVERLSSIVAAYREETLDRLVDERSGLDEAAAWWKRGDRREALHHLEMALGDNFYGLERLLDGAK